MLMLMLCLETAAPVAELSMTTAVPRELYHCAHDFQHVVLSETISALPD